MSGRYIEISTSKSAQILILYLYKVIEKQPRTQGLFPLEAREKQKMALGTRLIEKYTEFLEVVFFKSGKRKQVRTDCSWQSR